MTYKPNAENGFSDEKLEEILFKMIHVDFTNMKLDDFDNDAIERTLLDDMLFNDRMFAGRPIIYPADDPLYKNLFAIANSNKKREGDELFRQAMHEDFMKYLSETAKVNSKRNF